jgi:hypothetical protein
MKDGKLPDETGETPSGQDLVVPLLNRCLKFTEIVEQKYALCAGEIKAGLTLCLGRAR